MKKLAMFVGVLLLMSLNCYAQGDLTVNGTIHTGSGGISFPDATIQTGTSLLWDHKVLAATNEIPFPPLDGDADGGYDFEFLIENTLASTNGSYYLYANGDTTKSNYRRYYISANNATAVYYGTDSTPKLGGASAESFAIIRGTIIISPVDSGFRFLVNYSATNSDNLSVNFGTMQKKTPLGANLTSLTLATGGENSIGVNSRIRIWKRITSKPAIN